MANHTDDSGGTVSDALNSAAQAAALGETAEMDLAATVLSIGQMLLAEGDALLTAMLRPWVGYQALIVVGLLVVAHLLRAVLGPRIRAWMGTREGWPKWRMRVLVVVHQRLRSIFFVALIWAVVLVMREITWPSRSYVLGLLATLAPRRLQLLPVGPGDPSG